MPTRRPRRPLEPKTPGNIAARHEPNPAILGRLPAEALSQARPLAERVAFLRQIFLHGGREQRRAVLSFAQREMPPGETPRELNELLQGISMKETGRDQENVRRVKPPPEQKPKVPVEPVLEILARKIAKGQPRITKEDERTVMAEIRRVHSETPGGVLGQTFLVKLERGIVGVYISPKGIPHIFMTSGPKK